MEIHASNTQKLCEKFQDECNVLGKKEQDQREDCRLQTDRRDMLYCDAESVNPNHKLILFSEVDFENMNDVVEENNDIETEGETKVPSTSNSRFNKTDREFQKCRRRTNRIKYMSDSQVEKAKNDADRKVEECKENLSQTSSRLIAFTEKHERAQAEVRMHQETVFEPTEVNETVESPFANALKQYHEEKVLNPSGEAKSNTVLLVPGEGRVFNLTRHVSDQRKRELAIEMNYLKCTSDGSCTQDQLLGFFEQFSRLGEHRIALQVLYDRMKQHANKKTTSPECCLLDPENCVCFTGENHVYSLLNVVYVVVFLFKKTILISVVIPSIK